MFEIAIFPLVASAYTIPNVKNPIADILPNYGGSSPGNGVTQGPTSDTISGGNAPIQSCVIGGLIGGAIGLLGFAAGPVGILTVAGGATLGCGIAGAFFPQQGSAVYNQVSNAVPAVGDFLRAIATALAYFGPFLNFLSDSATYELQLLSLEPVIGAFLFPLQAMTLIWGFYTIAVYLRGVGTGIG